MVGTCQPKLTLVRVCILIGVFEISRPWILIYSFVILVVFVCVWYVSSCRISC